MKPRQLTVQRLSRQTSTRKHKHLTRYTKTIQIRLNGRWLEKAGFQAGQPVYVEVEPGCLVITPIKPEGAQSF